MANKKISVFFLTPIVVSLLLHAHVFKLDLVGYHVWRQSQTQTVIYNFSFSDNSILHPQRFDLTTGTTSLLYEFPIYQWLIAQVNNSFGYAVAHTRGISFLFFILFLIGFYRLCSLFVRTEIALFVNALLCFSPLLYYYCVNPLPDILALALATWSLHFFFKFTAAGKNRNFMLFCLFLMLAALVKLPYLLFGSVFILYLFKEMRHYTRLLKLSLIGLGFMLPVALWYAAAIPTWTGNPVSAGMTANTKSWLTLLDYLQFTLISSVPELLTNYASCIFLFMGIYLFFKNVRSYLRKHAYFAFLFIACSVYYVFEMNMIEKTHDYYLLPFIPLIFLVVACGVKFFYEKKRKKFLFFIVCLVPLTAWLRIDHRWNEKTPGFVTDYMTDQATLQALIPENAICVVDHDESKFIALYYLKRQGYSLLPGEINQETLKRLYLKEARYLITENPAFNPTDFPAFSFRLIFNKSLKLYQLDQK